MKLASAGLDVILHETPLAEIHYHEGVLYLDADDQDERRLRFEMRPFQAMRLTTSDCYSPTGLGPDMSGICEVIESEWLAELRVELARSDSTATFLDKAHHYLFCLQDDYLEVITWGITVRTLLPQQAALTFSPSQRHSPTDSA